MADNALTKLNEMYLTMFKQMQIENDKLRQMILDLSARITKLELEENDHK